MKKILVHRPHGRKLARLCSLVAGEALLMKAVIGKVTEENLNIGIRHSFKIFQSDLTDILAAELLFREEIKKDPEIVYIIEARQSTCARFHAAQKILAEIGKFLEKYVNLIKIFEIALAIIIGAVHRQICHINIIAQKRV